MAVREAFAHHSRRVLHAHSRRAQPPRSFVLRTPDSDPAVRAASNRLLDQPVPTAPNRVWVGDITYYNAERHYSALGYHSPSLFETHLQTTS